MKNRKLLIGIITGIILLFIIVLGVSFFFFNKKEKINVYLFWGNGCPHCEHAKEFFNDLEDEYGKYYNLVEYEVWYDEENQALMTKVSEELNIEAKGVPFIIIGDQYFKGYASSMDEEIKKEIVSQYENKDYTDIVEKVK